MTGRPGMDSRCPMAVPTLEFRLGPETAEVAMSCLVYLCLPLAVGGTLAAGVQLFFPDLAGQIDAERNRGRQSRDLATPSAS